MEVDMEINPPMLAGDLVLVEAAILGVESELPSCDRQDDSSSAELPVVVVESTTWPPDSEGSVTLNVSTLPAVSKTSIEVVPGTQGGLASDCSDCSLNSFSSSVSTAQGSVFSDSCLTGHSQRDATAKCGSRRFFFPEATVVETITEKVSECGNNFKREISVHKKEMAGPQVDDMADSCCSINCCRSFCVTLGCGLLTFAFIVFSPLIGIGFCLYELLQCICDEEECGHE